MPALDTEAAAWAEAGFDATMIGLRAAAERALLELRGVARTGGNVDAARGVLSALLRDVEQRARALACAPGAPMTHNAGAMPRGLAPPAIADAPAPWGMP